jgi:hypothetical protein
MDISIARRSTRSLVATEHAVLKLRDAAGQAGDLVMVAVCELALDRWTDARDTWALLSEADMQKLEAIICVPKGPRAGEWDETLAQAFLVKVMA